MSDYDPFEELRMHYSTTTLSVNGVILSHSYTEYPDKKYAIVTIYNIPIPQNTTHFFVYDHVYQHNIFMYVLKPSERHKFLLESTSFKIIVD